MITRFCTELIRSLRFLVPMRRTCNCSRQFFNCHSVRLKLKEAFWKWLYSVLHSIHLNWRIVYISQSLEPSLRRGLSTLSSGWIFVLVLFRPLNVCKASTHSFYLGCRFTGFGHEWILKRTLSLHERIWIQFTVGGLFFCSTLNLIPFVLSGEILGEMKNGKSLTFPVLVSFLTNIIYWSAFQTNVFPGIS